MNKKTWWKLDHHVWQQLKKYSLEKKSVIAALSGGADSLALTTSLINVLGPEKITIAHFHHGGNAEARMQALHFCEKFATEKNVQWQTETWQGAELQSEAQMREKRYQFFLDLQNKNPDSIVSTGHQQNDVIETRLMRLLRGTGPQGLKAIEVFRSPFFRPLLTVPRSEILVYLNKQNLIPVTDPSNKDHRYLRNWLRTVWLPQLEKKRPGSYQSLGRSLEALVQSLPSENSAEKAHHSWDLILRSQFLAQTEAEQTRWLARALLQSGRKDFTQFHLQEIRRRLIQSPKNNSFKVAGCDWQVNAQQIRVQLAKFMLKKL